MSSRPMFLVASLALVLLGGGCAKAIVDVSKEADLTLPKPDMMIIQNIAVTPNEVKLDRGIAKTVLRDTQKRKQTDEEVRVGHLVADRFMQDLIDKLEADGIQAFRGSSGVTPTDTSVVITGQFLNVDEGNQTQRVWLGFGLGGSELRIRGQMYQNGRMISKGETRTTPTLKPGVTASLATGAVTGAVGTAVVVGGTAAGFSEAFLTGVDADAGRTATAVHKNIHDYYVKRGWLAK